MHITKAEVVRSSSGVHCFTGKSLSCHGGYSRTEQDCDAAIIAEGGAKSAKHGATNGPQKL